MIAGKPSVGVVIRTLNESALLGRCLETLAGQQGGFDLDVVVVDSGSTDDTTEIARAAGARVIDLEPSAFDYSKALNVGIDAVEGELVVSLSAHAIPLDAGWLETVAASFSDQRVAGVSTRQVPWPEAPWQEMKRLRMDFPLDRQVYDDSGEGGSILFSNAASCIRRSAWQEHTFTLPAVEDLDWARRVVGAGWRIVYEPATAVYHSHDESPRAQARRLIDINRAHDAGMSRRTRRRTLREASGLVFRDARAILGLHEPIRAKASYLVELLATGLYYVVDFSRSGTTAERRRAEERTSGRTDAAPR